MIKVIASDMDGTLLGNDHQAAPETLAAIREACDAGIRFMINTGRNFPSAMEELKGADLVCDYIVSSGAEVRNPQKEVVMTLPMSMELCRAVYEESRNFPIAAVVCTDGYDYRVGDPAEVEESMLRELQIFYTDLDPDEAQQSVLYQQMKQRTKVVSDLEDMEKAGVPIYKLFFFSEDTGMLGELKNRLEKNPDIAVASSFPTNLEITDVRAQKGPVLKEYIESLGYTMDEVMVLGDSLNDLSMISMDFGATVAMENGDPEVKQAAKYITKSNAEFGVAYAIRELLKHQRQQTE